MKIATSSLLRVLLAAVASDDHTGIIFDFHLSIMLIVCNV